MFFKASDSVDCVIVLDSERLDSKFESKVSKLDSNLSLDSVFSLHSVLGLPPTRCGLRGVAIVSKKISIMQVWVGCYRIAYPLC